MNTTTLTITQASCADDYDPNSMPVAKARAFIHQFLDPVTGVLRVPVRSALGRVLAEDIIVARGRAIAPQLGDGWMGDAGGGSRRRRGDARGGRCFFRRQTLLGARWPPGNAFAS